MESLALVTAPATEPVTIGEVKNHCRIDITEDDALLQNDIVVARERVEVEIRRALLTQTWDWRIDRFPVTFDVPRAPLQSVTSIKYIDTGEVEQTLATSIYTVDAYSVPGRITKAYNEDWPNTLGHVNDVTVRFVCGYASSAAVPYTIKHALMMIVGELYKEREHPNIGASVETLLAANELLGPYKLYRL